MPGFTINKNNFSIKDPDFKRNAIRRVIYTGGKYYESIVYELTAGKFDDIHEKIN